MSPVIACVLPTASLGDGNCVSFSCTVKAASEPLETVKWSAPAGAADAVDVPPPLDVPLVAAVSPVELPLAALAEPFALGLAADAERVAGAAGSLLSV